MPGRTNSRLLDTSAIIRRLNATKRGEAPPFTLDGALTTWIVRGELEVGFAIGNHTNQTEREALEYLLKEVDTLGLSPAATEQYGRVFAALRRAGTPIPTNDVWIAASALEHGLTLVTRDGHFDNVPGLRVQLLV